MRGASYAGAERTLYAVTAAGAIVGTRTTARVYTHALVVQGREGLAVLSWHLGPKNAGAKRRSWDAHVPGQPVLEVAAVVEAPAGRAALEAVLAARRAAPPGAPLTPAERLDERNLGRRPECPGQGLLHEGGGGGRECPACATPPTPPRPLAPPAPRPVRRFSLSDAQLRVLQAAGFHHPSPCCWARAKYRRTVELLVSLQLVTGGLGGFTATPAGLQELEARGWKRPEVARSSVDGSVLEVPPEHPPAFPTSPERERFGDRDGGL